MAAARKNNYQLLDEHLRKAIGLIDKITSKCESESEETHRLRNAYDCIYEARRYLP